MALNDLKDVYIDQMQDLYSADRQSAKITAELAKKATDDELVSALEAGVKGIEQGMSQLEKLIKGHGADPTGEHCKGMEGLVKEARAHALEEEFGSDAARDAMIISQYQRMAHYAIAGYGCVATFAARLGLDDEAKVLRECTESTREGDERMTKIATSGINAAAA